jgi:hypothetical protein
VFNQPCRKKKRTGPPVSEHLFELDCLDEVSQKVPYQSEVAHADGGSGEPPPNSNEDKKHNNPWEDQEEQPHPNLPENQQPPTPGSTPLLSSIADYHQTVQRQRLATRALSNWENLTPQLHGAYVWLKHQTLNWTKTGQRQNHCSLSQITYTTFAIAPTSQ